MKIMRRRKFYVRPSSGFLGGGFKRGPLITAACGERIDFADSLESDVEDEDDVNDWFFYDKQLMSPWALYCALKSGSSITVTYF